MEEKIQLAAATVTALGTDAGSHIGTNLITYSATITFPGFRVHLGIRPNPFRALVSTQASLSTQLSKLIFGKR